MEGAKALYNFLKPIEIPEYEEQVPSYLFGYETDQIATILSGYETLEHLGQLHKVENAIVLTTIKEVLPRL